MDNLDLQEKSDALAEQNKKLRRQVKFYVKKLKDAGLAAEDGVVAVSVMEDSTVGQSRKSHQDNSALPMLRKKDVVYLGMFEFSIGDERLIVRNLIYGSLFILFCSVRLI